jgi:hypothetical protein
MTAEHPVSPGIQGRTSWVPTIASALARILRRDDGESICFSAGFGCAFRGVWQFVQSVCQGASCHSVSRSKRTHERGEKAEGKVACDFCTKRAA